MPYYINVLFRCQTDSIAFLNWYFYKGNEGQYPFHFDDKDLVESFFITLQKNFLEIFAKF